MVGAWKRHEKVTYSCKVGDVVINKGNEYSKKLVEDRLARSKKYTLEGAKPLKEKEKVYDEKSYDEPFFTSPINPFEKLARFWLCPNSLALVIVMRLHERGELSMQRNDQGGGKNQRRDYQDGGNNGRRECISATPPPRGVGT
ncbi:hypothetical protein ACFE04_029345 [Oxalis oulophora]